MTYLCRHRWEAEVRLKPFRYLGAKRSCLLSTILRSLCPREIFSTLLTGAWMGLGACLDRHGKSRPPHRDSIPRPSSRMCTAITLFPLHFHNLYFAMETSVNFDSDL